MVPSDVIRDEYLTFTHPTLGRGARRRAHHPRGRAVPNPRGNRSAADLGRYGALPMRRRRRLRRPEHWRGGHGRGAPRPYVPGRHRSPRQSHSAVGTMNGYGLAFADFPQHAAMLAASGITARARPRPRLPSGGHQGAARAVGVTKAGRNVPGLLVPMLRTDGSRGATSTGPTTRGYAAASRSSTRHPPGSATGIDVPPGVGRLLDDPAMPLWITEGVKKADCGARCTGCASSRCPGCGTGVAPTAPAARCRCRTGTTSPSTAAAS